MEIEPSGPGTHITGEQLDRLREGSLPPHELAAVGAHAATCEACGRAVAEVRAFQRMARDLRIPLDAGDEPEHLTADELMALADGPSRNHPHLQECEICRTELAELITFKSSMRRRRTWLPYAVAAAIAGIAVTIGLTIPRLDRPPTPVPPHHATTSTVALPQPSPVPVAVERRPEWDAWVAEVKSRRALPVPAVIAELRSQTTQLRGSARPDDLQLSPDHAVVASTQPRFQWSGQEGARYRVIFRNGDEIVESGELTHPRWSPQQELRRGREYQWQVELTIDGVRSLYPKPPDPPARFRVLDQRALDEIEDARQRHPDDALLQAVILARHGLRTETMAALDRLEGDDAALATDLRESLRRWPR
jgi:anti-sigma factor RsiW